MMVKLNLVEGTEHLFDEDGIEAESLESARAKATDAARSIMAHQLQETGRLNLNARIDITDEAGQIVSSVPFSEVVTIGSC